MQILIYAHLFAIAFIAAPSHQGASLSNLFTAMPPPPSHEDAWRSNLAATERRPFDLIQNLLQDPRDRRAVALAFFQAPVPTKGTNDNLIELLRVSDYKFDERRYRGYSARDVNRLLCRSHLDSGIIPTSNSAHIARYEALQGEVNARTNKPFKFFDTILLTANWQDDPVWQDYDWTTVSAIAFEYEAAIEINHDKLPMSRLNNLKEVCLSEPKNYEAIGPLLTLNPRLETLSLSLDRPANLKELALATCAMKGLKTFVFGPYYVSWEQDFVAEFAAEYMECLPAENKLESLEFQDDDFFNHRVIRPIAIAPHLIEKLHLKRFVCSHCRPEWAEQRNLEQLIWRQGWNRARNIKTLENILEMKSLVHLVLVFPLKPSPAEEDLVRRISLQVKNVQAHHDDDFYDDDESID